MAVTWGRLVIDAQAMTLPMFRSAPRKLQSINGLTEKYPWYFPWYLVVVVLITLAVLKSD